MDEQTYTSIQVSIVGHDTNSNLIMLQLPSGSLIPATVMKANFAKYLTPLFKNPPTQTIPTTVISDQGEAQTLLQAGIQLVKEDKEEKPDDLWWDIDAMFQEIRWHAKANERKIVLDERSVVPYRLAFKCIKTDKTWSVDIKYLYEYCDKLFTSPDKNLQSKGFQLRKCVSTVEGRQRLVESLNNAIK
jgi:hypothetical protein